jgi:uncharacterized protein (TIGR03435 family)
MVMARPNSISLRVARLLQKADALGLNTTYGLGVEEGLRVRGGPNWVRSDRYSIEAIAEGASDVQRMQGPMLQELLERRFQLKVHIDREQVPAFALVVAKGGLKPKPIGESECRLQPAPVPGVPVRRASGFEDVRRGEKPWCGLMADRNGPNFVFVAGAVKLGELSSLLGGQLGGVRIFDKTGTQDRFNFILEFAPDENTPSTFFPLPPSNEPSDIPRGADIFTALQEQLGLKLHRHRSRGAAVSQLNSTA